MTKRRYFKKPYRVRKKRSILNNKGFWFGFLAIIISGWLFYLIVFSVWFQVAEIKIMGNEKVCGQEIKKLIQPKIVQQIIHWETRSIFLANLNEANKAILKEFPLIGEVDIKRNFPDALIIAVTERKPVAVFYYEEQKFFIDKYGIIFEEILDNEYFYLKIESLILIEKLELGKRILEKELMGKILEIKQETKRIDISIKKNLIVSEERLNVKTLEGWEIYFNLKDDISAQIFHLNLVLNEKIPLEKRKNLEYIDLRFSPRVFFRYRD